MLSPCYVQKFHACIASKGLQQNVISLKFELIWNGAGHVKEAGWIHIMPGK